MKPLFPRPALLYTATMSKLIDFAAIKEIQRKSRQGEAGRLRKEFNRSYRALLDSSYEEIRGNVSGYISSTGESVTCAKGCAYCCEHFVSVPVSHAIVATDYLYASENAMSAFLRSYPAWLSAIEDNPAAKAVFDKLEEDTTLRAIVKQSSEKLRSAYHHFAIPCPFLVSKRCSIYPVRPIACAAFFSLTSPEFCLAENEIPVVHFQAVPSPAKLKRMSELTNYRLWAHQESLPKLVYRLLTVGLPEVSREVDKLFNTPQQPGEDDPRP